MTTVPRNTVLVGDAAERLSELPSDSVDTVVTSPPYFAMRDYQAPDQIGLEPSVHVWVDRLTAVADEIARVLKPHGAFWLNVGDAYSRHHRYGAPAKALLLAPERLLRALSDRDWIIRNKVAWCKTHHRPEPVRDRLTVGPLGLTPSGPRSPCRQTVGGLTEPAAVPTERAVAMSRSRRAGRWLVTAWCSGPTRRTGPWTARWCPRWCSAPRAPPWRQQPSTSRQHRPVSQVAESR